MPTAEHQVHNSSAAEPQQPTPPPIGPSAQVEAGARFPSGADDERLLSTDLRVAFLLLNRARYRTLERLFGVGKHDANLLTAVIALLAAGKAEHFVGGLALPLRPDFALGIGAGRTLIEGIAGPSARDTPLFASLVTLAVLGAGARPAVARSAHAIKAASREVGAAFNRRYGHPNGDSAALLR